MRCQKTRGVFFRMTIPEEKRVCGTQFGLSRISELSQFSNFLHRRATTGRGALALVQDQGPPNVRPCVENAGRRELQ